MKQIHPFHIVFIRPWPLLTSIRLLSILLGTSLWVSTKNINLIVIGLILTSLISFQWWRDVSRERSLQGFHSIKVIKGLRWGIILFITSEVLFFISFFWSFFHSSLAPNIELGRLWPPLGVISINPFQVPLLNTAVLLARGITVTWCHHSLINLINQKAKISLSFTILLGFYFTLLQGWEYWDSSFNISDRAFGAVFFIATGFHGLHVIIGSLFLFFSFLRFKINTISKIHHVGLERAIWYWHFVDVVWLFLFSFIYWWSYYSVNTNKVYLTSN
jgi:cytochrome c oxidase subunit 3